MAPIDDDEEERREVIRRLEHRYQEAQAKRVKAEADAADARREEASLLDARRRAQRPFPAANLCPECWIMHGEEHPLHAVPHPHDTRHFERWRCSACGHIEDRKIGL